MWCAPQRRSLEPFSLLDNLLYLVGEAFRAWGVIPFCSVLLTMISTP